MYRKTASDVLEEYIDKFEGRPRPRHYTRRVSDLLSPQPKFKYLDSVERQFDSEMNDINEGLLSWINDSYQDSLRSTCRPAYLQQDADSSSQPRRDNHARSRMDLMNKSNYASTREPTDTHQQILDDEISTLPSPSMSNVGIDSDQDTTETEVLLSSYLKKAGGQRNTSWVKNSVTNSAYPQWVDDVNQSIDAADPRRLSSVSVLLKSQDSNPLNSHSRSLNATGLTMDDTASVDTEVVLESSVYGNRPINMGGELHTSLFKDPRVESILNESRRKVRKHRENILGRSVHGVSTASVVKAVNDSMQSPESRDVAYTNRILNKHRSFDGNSSGSYFKGSRRQILQESNHEGHTSSKDFGNSAYPKEIRDSRTPFVNSSPTASRKSTRDTNSSRNVGIASELRRNVSNPTIERPVAHDIDTTRRSLVNDSLTRSYMKNPTLNTSQKDIDVMEGNSRGTSGYHSDNVSPIHAQKTPDRPASSQRASSPKHISALERIRSPNKDQGTLRRKDSNVSQGSASTDVLIRQPPTGTKLHQRSKTWASSSFRSKLPHAMSTPKPQLYSNDQKLQAFNVGDDKARYEQYEAARPRSSASQTVSGSVSLGIPPSSSPHSTAVARMANGHTSPYLSSSSVAREAAAKSRYSDLAVLKKPAGLGSSYTSWRSSALGSGRLGGFVVREEEVGVSTEGDEDQREIVTGRYTAEDPHLSPNDEEINDEDLHNRTWPSLEKLKARSKLSYLPRKDEIILSPKSSWTEQKRSIPLRPANTAATRDVSSTFSHPHSVSNGYSYADRPISHSSYRSAINKHEQLSPHRNYSQSKTTELSSRSSNIAGTSNRPFTPSTAAGQFHRSPHYAERSLHRKDRSPYTGNTSHVNRDNTVRDDIDADDDNATIDTDLLLIQPPMPVVDASPSLSTVSDDECTVKDADSEATSQSFAELPVRPSSKVSFAPDVSFNGRRGISPLSTFASTNPRTADLDALRGSIYNAVQEGNQTQKFNSTLAAEPKAMRSEILDSFIEDCMRNANGVSSDKAESKMNPKHFDGEEYKTEPPRTVETLKHMVLNLNGVADGYREGTEEKAAKESSEDNIESDNNSDDASSFVGEQSLARAYHHLERLKSLISGKVD